MIRQLLSVLALVLPLNARPNVLFLAVDDLRPELASFGASYIHYDHRNEPGETRNLADKNPDLVREFAAELDRRLR